MAARRIHDDRLAKQGLLVHRQSVRALRDIRQTEDARGNAEVLRRAIPRFATADRRVKAAEGCFPLGTEAADIDSG